ncbi:MAG: 30S ribosomal protein S6 [Gammaproteobacteria bacterium]|nr:30S ribosomal protein S6 [Gammaproteobacteria bacterium]
MRHYEIVFLVHPDQSEQVPAMIDRYKEMVTSAEGNIHRVEDWGRRRLAYTINDIHKAHYVMINIECGLDTLREIERNFKFNDSILRHLVIKRNAAVTDESFFAKEKAAEDQVESSRKAEAAPKPETARQPETVEETK